MSNKAAELYDMINQKNPSNSADFESNEKLSARQRIDIIFDKGTFVETGSFIGEGDENSIDSYGAVITGYGSINGNLVFAFSQDYSRLYGALTPSQTMKIVNLINLAIDKGANIHTISADQYQSLIMLESFELSGAFTKVEKISVDNLP